MSTVVVILNLVVGALALYGATVLFLKAFGKTKVVQAEEVKINNAIAAEKLKIVNLEDEVKSYVKGVESSLQKDIQQHLTNFITQVKAKL